MSTQRNCLLTVITIITIAALAAGAQIVLAHHSVAMFDSSKTITVHGVVKEFQWTNPHVVLWVNSDEKTAGGRRTWAIEMTSPGVLTRNGWTKRAFMPGDRVDIDVGPLRDGQPGGLFKKRNSVGFRESVYLRASTPERRRPII